MQQNHKLSAVVGTCCFFVFIFICTFSQPELANAHHFCFHISSQVSVKHKCLQAIWTHLTQTNIIFTFISHTLAISRIESSSLAPASIFFTNFLCINKSISEQFVSNYRHLMEIYGNIIYSIVSSQSNSTSISKILSSNFPLPSSIPGSFWAGRGWPCSSWVLLFICHEADYRMCW